MTPVEFILQNRPYFEDFITRSVYHSNAIEGSTLSYAETYAIIWNDNDFKVRATARELYEAINLKYAMSYIIDNAGNFLTEKMIIHIGVLINRNIDEIDGYRTIPVQIRGAEHIPPAPELVRNAMMYFAIKQNMILFLTGWRIPIFNLKGSIHFQTETGERGGRCSRLSC